MTFEYKLNRSVQNWCQESDAIRTRPHLQKILQENSQLLDVHERRVFNTVESVYRYGLSDQGYTLLSLDSDMIQILKLLTRLAEKSSHWPTSHQRK